MKYNKSLCMLTFSVLCIVLFCEDCACYEHSKYSKHKEYTKPKINIEYSSNSSFDSSDLPPIDGEHAKKQKNKENCVHYISLKKQKGQSILKKLYINEQDIKNAADRMRYSELKFHTNEIYNDLMQQALDNISAQFDENGNYKNNLDEFLDDAIYYVNTFITYVLEYAIIESFKKRDDKIKLESIAGLVFNDSRKLIRKLMLNETECFKQLELTCKKSKEILRIFDSESTIAIFLNRINKKL